MKLFSAMMLSVLMVVVVGAMESVVAQKGRAKDAKYYLGGLSRAVESLGNYEVRFNLIVGTGDSNMSVQGLYRVAGERYMLSVGDNELYGDGEYRCTVNSAEREVIYERVDVTLPILMVNPARAFLSLDKSFNGEIMQVQSGVVDVELVPRKRGGNMLVKSVLAISEETLLPLSVSYVTEEDAVRIEICEIEVASGGVLGVDDVKVPQDYEVVDIR